MTDDEYLFEIANMISISNSKHHNRMVVLATTGGDKYIDQKTAWLWVMGLIETWDITVTWDMINERQRL